MRMDRELTLTMSAMAAVAGTAFASGREMVLFFGRLGWAAWPGMILSSALFGMMTGAMVYFAKKTGAGSFQAVFRRLTGKYCGEAVGILYGLLMALAAAMMLRICGELGALALPTYSGYLQGMLMALLAAVIIGAGRSKFLPVLGMCAVTAAVVFYAGLFLDGRRVHVYAMGETLLRLEGSLWAAVILALLHACLNASVAAGTVMRFAGGSIRPRRTACMSAAVMFICLLCAHAAISRGGEELYAQSLPTVILAARWGLAGFWLSTGFMYLMSVCTLSACLCAIAAQMTGSAGERRSAAVMLLMAFLFAYALGVDGAIGFGFPVLGWICAFSMAALACWFERGTRTNVVCGRRLAGREKNDRN